MLKYFTRKPFFFIFIFYFLFFTKIKAQEYVLNYEQFTTKQGLANDFVTCITQDKKGFMWFGTQDGLCRYDGNSYRVYKTNIEKNYVLLSNNIISLATFNDSLIYVGTEAGLHILNTNQNTITPVEGFKNKYVNQVFIDSKKTIWVVIQDSDIFIQKKRQNNWQLLTKTHFEFNGGVQKHITEQKINGKLEILMSKHDNGYYADKTLYKFEKNNWKPIFHESNVYLEGFYKGNLLVAKNLMIHQYHSDTLYKNENFNIKYIKAKNKEENRIVNNFSSKIYQNYLYIPLHSSVLVVDLNTYKVKHEIKTADKNGAIKGIYIDASGNLWVATYGSGVFLFPTYSINTIKGYRFDKDNFAKGLSSTSTRAIYQNAIDQKLWIGTYSEKRIIDIFSKQNIKTTLPIKISHAFTIKEDKVDKNILWVATYNGILKIDQNKPSLKKVYFRSQVPTAIEIINDSILIFAEPKNICVFNTKKEKTHKKIPINKTTYLYKSAANTVWIGTKTDGFASWNLKTDKIIYYNPEKNSVIKSLHVKCIYEDTKGKLWVATTKGLYSYDKKTTQIEKYTTKDGLPHNLIYGILEDDDYNLWLSTNKGISKFNIEKKTFENFDVNDGLQDNEYNTYSFHKGSDGKMFFGGIKGVDAFFPKDLKRNTHIPNLILTGFKRFGKDIKTKTPIEKISTIILPLDSAQMLTFEFTALNFYQSKRNKYAYKIEEIDTTWIELGNKNEFTLTNLSAGNYTIRIKGSNNHGIWNEEGITLKLNIIPPFWQQSWFLFGIMILFLMGVYLLYKIRMYQAKRREEELEVQIKERTKELATANKNKDQLFAIIAHDLRSPLTAFEDIPNQIEYFLRKNKTKQLLELGKHIGTSIQGLNTLLNNLLNWALIQQNHQIQSNPQTVSLSEIIQHIVSIYQNVAQSNQIELNNLLTNDKLEIIVDIDSFQTILRNLISNALKYTPPNGRVEVSAIQKNEKIILIIKDTGIGMPQELIDNIFSPSIISNRGIRGEKGTGLGLVLCQEFAQINNIEIKVKSQPNKGSIFSLHIPSI